MKKPFLQKQDPKVYEAILAEEKRQRDGLEMIASENYVSEAVLETLGSIFTNKYSEGYPGKRYYGGQEYTDVVESLARARAQKIFGAEHANVQPLSGAPANISAYAALLEPGDCILGMDLSHGGHLTHGFTHLTITITGCASHLFTAFFTATPSAGFTGHIFAQTDVAFHAMYHIFETDLNVYLNILAATGLSRPSSTAKHISE